MTKELKNKLDGVRARVSAAVDAAIQEQIATILERQRTDFERCSAYYWATLPPGWHDDADE